MIKHVTIINGATRINGNTDTLLAKIIEGASGTEVRLKLVNLREKKIGNCIGCYQCLGTGTCSLQDDMSEIRDNIQSADLLVFASPLYWCSVTGLMKTFIDRFFFYYHPQTRGKISGKRAIAITAMNQSDVANEAKALIDFYSRLLNCLGVKLTKMIFWGSVMERNAVSCKSHYLESAYAVGRDLVKLAERENISCKQPEIQIIT